jgi:ATP-dependent DNA ligase
MSTGILDGKMTETRIPIYEGKNIGKVNETTHYTQAMFELNSKIESKIREGYVEDVKNLKSKECLGSGVKQVMLANKYDPNGLQKGSKTLDKMGLRGKTVIVQRKLDGNRCMTIVNKLGASMYTRKGDLMKPFPHIIEEIYQSFLKYQKKHPEVEKLELDGELYSHTISFNLLNGLLKKEERSPEIIEKLSQVSYWLYDVMTDDGYEIRKEIIKEFGSKSVVVLESVEVEAEESKLEKLLEEYLAAGYEGAIIRVLGKGYDYKRSWNLLKYKIFEDAEFRIVGVEKDVRGDYVANFIMELDKPSFDREGKQLTSFKAPPKGFTREEMSEMWNNQEDYIGEVGVVTFFQRSEYNIPRFPKFKGLRSDVSLSTESN